MCRPVSSTGIYPTNGIPSPDSNVRNVRHDLFSMASMIGLLVFHYLAVASALVEASETFALDWCHAVPIVNEIAQIDPRFAGTDVARQQVATARFQPDTAGGIVRRRQNPSVRQCLASRFRHFELFLDTDFVSSRPFGAVVQDALHVRQYD